ncbi:MAG TPA: class II aldolase/adducin family protein [Anaeromyxobacteraceae bacterium]|nr:class II aldolase/adducin family protein [Anaeromyxobacteraceae bacterium]
MRKVISVRELEELLKKGSDLSTALPQGALLTPSARDLLRERGLPVPAPSPLAEEEPASRPAREPPPRSARPAATSPLPAEGYRRVPEGEIDRFFKSPEVEKHKESILDIGRRLWQRAYVDGNGGNISIRVAEDLVLCTPTLVSKGFMKPSDLCLVDTQGVQKAGGDKRRTSELLMHLAIYRAQPRAKACVHAHPPYATGFAISGVSPPTCMVPEVEVMIGEVPIAPYITPGTQAMADACAALADTHNTILMANHGVVTWGFSVEDAYFKMEILEAYCRTVLVTAQLGKDPNFISAKNVGELLKVKKNLGIPDRRMGLKECELCDNSEWRPGVTCTQDRSDEGPPRDLEAEALVERVTDEIVRALKGS